MSNAEFSGRHVKEAYQRIAGFVHKTPVLTSSQLNALTNKDLFFKCENLQKTGSFKARGALNAMKFALQQNPNLAGVITHSSGNHGQALAWAAMQHALPCVVVMPSTAPNVKKAAIRAYGAQIYECNPSERKLECNRLSVEKNLLIIDPHDDYDVMAGQGTIAVELFEQLQENKDHLDAIIISVGGGGLASGIAKYAKSVDPNLKIFCVEPSGKLLGDQLKCGKRATGLDPLQTIADGIRVRSIGERCFQTLVECCEPTVFDLSDDEIVAAQKLIFQYLKVVVEPSAALPLAAVLKFKTELQDCKRIALILCGGNLCLDSML